MLKMRVWTIAMRYPDITVNLEAGAVKAGREIERCRCSDRDFKGGGLLL